MLKKATVEFTDEEAQLVVQLLQASRKWEGSPQDMASVLNHVFEITRRFDAAFNPPTTPPQEALAEIQNKNRRRRK